MSRRAPATAALLLAAAATLPGVAGAASSFAFDAVSDLDGGRSTLGGIAVSGETWSWHLDSTHSTAPASGAATAGFESDELALGIGWTRGAWSVALDGAYWADSDGGRNRTLGLDLAWQGAAWRVAFEPRFGRLTTTLPSTTSAELERRGFERSALGGSVEWRGERWTWWAGFADWDYDPALAGTSNALTEELGTLVDLGVVTTLLRRGQYALVDQYLLNTGATELRDVLQTEGLAGLAQLIRYQVRRVRYAATLNSFALGLSDGQHRLGVERAFDRGALSFDYERLAVPVEGLQADSYALRWRWPLSGSLDLTLSAGWTDAERYDRSRFAGLTLQWYLD